MNSKRKPHRSTLTSREIKYHKEKPKAHATMVRRKLFSTKGNVILIKVHAYLMRLLAQDKYHCACYL